MNARKAKDEEPDDDDTGASEVFDINESVDAEPVEPDEQAEPDELVETPEPDPVDVGGIETDEADSPEAAEPLSDADEALLDQAATDLVAEMRSDMLRAQAELVNFRTRVERDRAANRDAVIAEVVRSLLPALDDLARAEKHGDLEGSPLEVVAVKLHSSLERFGLRSVGVIGEPFDPHLHEAVVQLPSDDVTVQTVADVIDPGYALGERLIRAAKVAVSVPKE
jgi:molecular chaperone GrpE